MKFLYLIVITSGVFNAFSMNLPFPTASAASIYDRVSIDELTADPLYTQSSAKLKKNNIKEKTDILKRVKPTPLKKNTKKNSNTLRPRVQDALIRTVHNIVPFKTKGLQLIAQWQNITQAHSIGQ